MPPFDEAAAPEARLRSDFAALQGPRPIPQGARPIPTAARAFRELPPSTAEGRAARIARGLVAYRKPGPKGACAGCHSAAAIDLAFIGFSDADILRRAIPQVGVDDARAVVDLVHALREQHRIDRPLHPRRFRFLQPGHEVLPELPQPLVYPGDEQPVGVHDAARDAAFARSLVDDVKLRLVGEPIRTLAEARAAETQLRQLDLRRLRVGVPFERWTEDGFHGPGSNVPTEWVAMLARAAGAGRGGALAGAGGRLPGRSQHRQPVAHVRRHRDGHHRRAPPRRWPPLEPAQVPGGAGGQPHAAAPDAGHPRLVRTARPPAIRSPGGSWPSPATRSGAWATAFARTR